MRGEIDDSVLLGAINMGVSPYASRSISLFNTYFARTLVFKFSPLNLMMKLYTELPSDIDIFFDSFHNFKYKCLTYIVDGE